MHFRVSRSKDDIMFLRLAKLLMVYALVDRPSSWSTMEPVGDSGRIPLEDRLRIGIADSLAALTVLYSLEAASSPLEGVLWPCSERAL